MSQAASQESFRLRPSLVRREGRAAESEEAGRSKASLEATPQLVGGAGEMAPQLPPSRAGHVTRLIVKKTARSE